MAKKTLRVGVIGTGGISRYHVGGWQRSGLGDIVAACDVQPERVDGFREEFGLPAEHVYTDARKMLRREQLDAVSIATWAQHHARLVAAAARAGVRGILCEKPLGYSVGEGEAMRKAAEATGARVMVTHQRRYSTRYTEAAKLIAKGAIGQPLTLVGRGGGGLTNTHSHTVDMMRYMLGNPETRWVMAQVERSTNRWERCYPIEDCLVGTIAFEGGARGVIESDLQAEGETGGLWIYGTKGAIDLFGGPFLMNESTGGTWQPIEAEESDPPVCYCRDLAKWLDGGPEPRISLRQALTTNEILMGFYESARTRTCVTFPLRRRGRILEQMIDAGDLPLQRKKKPYDIRQPESLNAGYR
jgi:predicted dehydrogenase